EDFQSQLPVKIREKLASLQIARLGSAVSTSEGHIKIEYRHPCESNARDGAKPIHLWLAASSVGAEGSMVLVHEDQEIRKQASPAEFFIIPVSEAASLQHRRGRALASVTPQDILEGRKAHQDFANLFIADAKATFAARGTRNSAFWEHVAPALIVETSTVVRG